MDYSLVTTLIDKLVDPEDSPEKMDTIVDDNKFLGFDSKDYEKRMASYRYIGTYIKKLSAGPFLMDPRADIPTKDEQYFAEYGYDRKGPVYEKDILNTEIKFGDLKGCTVVFCGRPLTYQDLYINESRENNEPKEGTNDEEPELKPKPQLTSHYIWWVRVPDGQECPSVIVPEVREYWHGLRPALFVIRDDKDPKSGLFYSASHFTEAMFMQADFDVVIRCNNFIQIRGIKIPLLPIEQVQKKAMAKRNNTGDPDAVIKLKEKVFNTPPSVVEAEVKPVEKPVPVHTGPRMFPNFKYEKSEGNPDVLFKKFLRAAKLRDILNPESEFEGNVSTDATLGLCFDLDKVVDIHPEIAKIQNMITDKVEYEEIDRNLADEEYLAQYLMKKKMLEKQEKFDAKQKEKLARGHAIYGHVNWERIRNIVNENTNTPSFAVHEIAHLFFKLGDKDANLLAYRKTGQNKLKVLKEQDAHFGPKNTEVIDSTIQRYFDDINAENRANPLPDPWIHESEDDTDDKKKGSKKKKNNNDDKKKTDKKKEAPPPPVEKPSLKSKTQKKESAGKSEKENSKLDSYFKPTPQHKNQDTKDAPQTDTNQQKVHLEKTGDEEMTKNSSKKVSLDEEDPFKTLMANAKISEPKKTPPKKVPAKEVNDTKKNEPEKTKSSLKEPKEDPKQSKSPKKNSPKSESKKPTEEMKKPASKPEKDNKATEQDEQKVTGKKRSTKGASENEKDEAKEEKKTPTKKARVDDVSIKVSSIEEAKGNIKTLKQEATNTEKQKTKLMKEIDGYKAKIAEYKTQLDDVEKLICVKETKIASMDGRSSEITKTIAAYETEITRLKQAEEQEAKRNLLQKRKAEEADAKAENEANKKDTNSKPPAKKAKKTDDGDECKTLYEFVDNHMNKFIDENGEKALEKALQKAVRDKYLISETKVYDTCPPEERKRLVPITAFINNYLPKDELPSDMEECGERTKKNIVKHVMTSLNKNRQLLTEKNPLKKYENFHDDEEKKHFLRNLAVALSAFVLRYQQLQSMKKNTEKKKDDAKDNESDSDLDGFV